MRTCGAAFGPQLRSKLRAIGVGHMLVQLDNATEPKSSVSTWVEAPAP